MARCWPLAVTIAPIPSDEGPVGGGGAPTETIEAAYRKAVAIAQAQSAKSWELRAATRLARLWHSQGKTTEAHDLLAPVYGWFTEGFDTADLKEAKSLLKELSWPHRLQD